LIFLKMPAKVCLKGLWMILKDEIRNKIEAGLNDKIDSLKPVGGGCINDAQLLKCISGAVYFLKVNLANLPGMFENEANGLNELKKANAIRVPDVIMVDKNFILLENISSSGKTGNFYAQFGERFAMLHKYTNDMHGFRENNYIGSNPQLNLPSKSEWKDFYWENRILFQYKLCEKNGYATAELKKEIAALENKLDSILAGSENTPSLLHGDLWSGNYIVDEKGEACLIDPAVYYGNREADLAMTKLFGGFTNEFYKSYLSAYPLPEGWEYRENLYKLYHILNHLNLFGTGYYSQAISLIKFYL
jgi:protein-ribulosamine 3-kinase